MDSPQPALRWFHGCVPWMVHSEPSRFESRRAVAAVTQGIFGFIEAEGHNIQNLVGGNSTIFIYCYFHPNLGFHDPI